MTRPLLFRIFGSGRSPVPLANEAPELLPSLADDRHLAADRPLAAESPRFLRKQIDLQAIADLKELLNQKTGLSKSDITAPMERNRIETGNAIRTTLEIGAIIRDRRKKIGLSQKALCEKAGVGTRFMVELEAGKKTLELGKVLQVMSLLGLNLIVVD